MVRREDIALAFARQAEFMCEFGPGTRHVVDGIEVVVRKVYTEYGLAIVEGPPLPGAVPAQILAHLRDGRLEVEIPEAWKEAVRKHGYGLEE